MASPIITFFPKTDTTEPEVYREFQQTDDEIPPELYGNKGHRLVDMCRRGYNVAPGIILPVGYGPPKIVLENRAHGEYIEKHLTDVFASFNAEIVTRYPLDHPCLFSTRSGAPVSMPGMLDTILNIGLDPIGSAVCFQDFRDWIGSKNAYLMYIKFLRDIGQKVFGTDEAGIDEPFLVPLISSFLNDLKATGGLPSLSAAQLGLLVHRMRKEIDLAIEDYDVFPTNLLTVVSRCAAAVFKSWNSERAVKYRKINSLSDSSGTAVIVQLMAFGNKDSDSGSGVFFTSNLETGAKKIQGEFDPMAQGESLVGGKITPLPLDDDHPTLNKIRPELLSLSESLEKDYEGIQEAEFTVESGIIFLFQSRNAPVTADLVAKRLYQGFRSGETTLTECLCSLDYGDFARSERYSVTGTMAETSPDIIAKGFGAGGGAIHGEIVLGGNLANLEDKPSSKIYVNYATTPEDIPYIAACDGLLTSTGGITSHAAVVARSMGKPCVVGAEDISVSDSTIHVSALNRVFCSGEIITIDGSTGFVYGKAMDVKPGAGSKEVLFFVSKAVNCINGVLRVPQLFEGVHCPVEIMISDYDEDEDVVEAISYYAQDLGVRVYLNVTPQEHLYSNHDIEALGYLGVEIQDFEGYISDLYLYWADIAKSFTLQGCKVRVVADNPSISIYSEADTLERLLENPKLRPSDDLIRAIGSSELLAKVRKVARGLVKVRTTPLVGSIRYQSVGIADIINMAKDGVKFTPRKRPKLGGSVVPGAKKNLNYWESPV